MAILKAIGWRDHNIFAQFIIESLLVSVTGGIAGVGCGYAVFRIIAMVMGVRTDTAYQVINVPAVLLAVGSATVVAGIIAGLVPAVKAATSRPAEILRNPH